MIIAAEMIESTAKRYDGCDFVCYTGRHVANILYVEASRIRYAAALATAKCDEGDHAAGSNGDKCFCCFVYNERHSHD